jgi:hypothetical protein
VGSSAHQCDHHLDLVQGIEVAVSSFVPDSHFLRDEIGLEKSVHPSSVHALPGSGKRSIPFIDQIVLWSLLVISELFRTLWSVVDLILSRVWSKNGFVTRLHFLFWTGL